MQSDLSQRSDTSEADYKVDYQALIQNVQTQKQFAKQIPPDLIFQELLAEQIPEELYLNKGLESLSLSVRAANVLDNLNIHTLDQLLSAKISVVFQARNSGIGTICSIMQKVGSLQKCSIESFSALIRRKYIDDEQKIDMVEFVHRLAPNVGLMFFDWIATRLKGKAKKAVFADEAYNMAALAELCYHKDSEVASSIYQCLYFVKSAVDEAYDDCSRRNLAVIYWRIAYGAEPPPAVCDPPIDGPVGLRIVDILSTVPSRSACLIGRLKGGTLMAVSPETGQSREWSRQRVLLGLNALVRHPGFILGYREAAKSALLAHGGIAGKEELDFELIGLTAPVNTRRLSFLDQMIRRPECSAAGITMMEDMVTLKPGYERTYARIKNIAVDVIRGCADVNIEPEIYSASVQAVLSRMNTIFGADGKEGLSGINITRDTLKRAVDDFSNILIWEGDRIYSRLNWGLTRGSKSDLVESILLHADRPMHVTQIQAETNNWLGDGQHANARGLVDLSENILLWGVGTYVHKDSVRLPHSLLDEMSNWIDKRLEVDIPYISVAGVFAQFKERCIAGGIPNRSALYGALCLLYRHRFNLQEYPYIRRLKSEERVPLRVVIDHYLQSAGGPIPREDFYSFLTNILGVEREIANYHLLNMPNMLMGKTSVIHIENLNYDKKILQELMASIRSDIARYGETTVFKLPHSYPVLFSQLGVSDFKLVHSLLLHQADGAFTGIYPRVSAIGNPVAEKSTVGQLAEFVRSKNRECTYSEVLDEFMTKRGWSKVAVRPKLKWGPLAAYSDTAVIHLSTLGWNEYKQSALVSILSEHYERAIADGSICASLTDIIERFGDTLPDIKPFTWSRYLAHDFLKKSGGWLFIGNAHDAFLPAENKLNIKSLDDYVSVWLRRQHNGIVQREQLEQELRQQNVIGNRLTRKMLGKDSKVILLRGGAFLRPMKKATA